MNNSLCWVLGRTTGIQGEPETQRVLLWRQAGEPLMVPVSTFISKSVSDIILMETQCVFLKIPQHQEMKIYVVLLCCVQIKLYTMTKSAVFLILLSVAPCPEL